MVITYLGKRPQYFDALYGTGHWTQGETKTVADSVSKKMLQHPDQYAEKPGELSLGTVVGALPTPPAESPDQDARDSVAYMDKATLLDYARTHYRQNLDKRLGADALRAKVVQLIDQFGTE
jgi:hypothetical protein